ncbi:MAG: hypothetical protein IJJ26_00940 [Victivallales bacterium]|nr:hypothetical protein [Victivallales bacterium]
MKRITIACLLEDRQSAVAELGRLGTVHVTPLTAPASEELDSLRKESEKLSRIVAYFQNLGVKPEKESALTPSQLVEQASASLDMVKKCEEEQTAVEKSLEQLRPWGSFDKKAIEALEAHGLHVYLCQANASKLPKLEKDATIRVIHQERSELFFAVFSASPIPENSLPLATLPEKTSVAELQKDYNDIQTREDKYRAALEELAAGQGDKLAKYQQELSQRTDFAKARDGMAASEHLCFLRGYVPENKVDAVREAARTHGWAIRYEDVPEDDAAVPTHLIIPKPFRMAQAIFDFVGILPSYHEVDVSISMLIFLSLFCGMLVGDAGYGAIFLVTVGILRHRCKDAKTKDGLTLLLIMSACIFVWGALTGSWFSIPTEKLPRVFQGLPWLTDQVNKDKHIQLLCFFIGAIQMSLARVWRTVLTLLKINFKQDSTASFLRKVREALGHVGWAFFLWGSYGLAKLLLVDGKEISALSGTFCTCYGIGFVLIALGSINWGSFVDVIYSPFTFLNTFVDTLSYIRLFAVGGSTFYIADSFNKMAAMVYGDHLWAIPFALLILLVGHALNVALALMGVLVHGIRLNTLEFSGHMDISWAGQAYKPLQNPDANKQ